jgi:hypothetical protein
MKKILIVCTVAAFWFFSCGKKSEPAPTPKDFLTSKSWKPESIKFSIKLEPEFITAFIPEPFKSILDSLRDIDAVQNQLECEKDDRFEFRKNGTYVLLDGEIKCPDFETEEGLWKLSNDFKLFTIEPQFLTGGEEFPEDLPFDVAEIFTDMEVVELTNQRFKVKKSSTQKLEGVTIPGLPVQIPISLKFEVSFDFSK